MLLLLDGGTPAVANPGLTLLSRFDDETTAGLPTLLSTDGRWLLRLLGVVDLAGTRRLLPLTRLLLVLLVAGPLTTLLADVTVDKAFLWPLLWPGDGRVVVLLTLAAVVDIVVDECILAVDADGVGILDRSGVRFKLDFDFLSIIFAIGCCSIFPR